MEINVFEPPAELFAANPLATVPVLVVNGKTPDDRFTIGDSATLLEFLHENHGERIWPSDLALRARVRAASTLAEGLMTGAVGWYLETLRARPDSDFLKETETNVERTLAAIAATSLRAPPWKISDLPLTQAGYDLIVALQYLNLRIPSLEWPARYPELARFVESHQVRQDIEPTAPPA